MAAEDTHVDPRGGQAGAVTTGQMVDRLERFDGPPEQFLGYLLAVQCGLVSAAGGAVFRLGEGGQVEILAVHPSPGGGAAPAWVGQVAGSVAQTPDGAATIKPLHDADDLYGQPARSHVIMVPLWGERQSPGLAAYLMATADPDALAAAREQLELPAEALRDAPVASAEPGGSEQAANGDGSDGGR